MKNKLTSGIFGAALLVSSGLAKADNIPEPLMQAIQEYQGKSIEACLNASNISDQTLEEIVCLLGVNSEIIISLKKIKIDCKNLLNVNTKVSMNDCESDEVRKLVNEGHFQIIINSLRSFFGGEEQPVSR